MADDYELKNDKKAIEDLINNYKKERLINRKKEIINLLSNNNLDETQAKEIEKELHDVILSLAKIK